MTGTHAKIQEQPLEALGREAEDRWTQLHGQGSVDLAREGVVLDLANATTT
jgi:hypothetical protein